jgi:uncharacterized phiE125 gp8 family phage protein
MLIDLERPAPAADMIAELAQHLRLPSGFPDEADHHAALRRCWEVALRLVEERTRRVLLSRRVAFRYGALQTAQRIALPVAPVVAIEALEHDDGEGARVAVDPSLWRLEAAGGRFVLAARAGRRLPEPPRDGFAEARLLAGFGDRWEDMPEDLRYAALLIAASVFEGRGERAGASLPAASLALLERYREVRL